MPRQYIFLLHGIGRQPAGWSDAWQQCFVDNLRKYAPYSGLTPEQIRSDHVEFVPVGYDSVFQDDFRAVWKNLAQAVLDQPKLLGEDERKQLGDLRDQLDPESQSVLWDSVLDVFLWYGWRLARERVVAKVNAQLGAGLDRMKTENQVLGDAHLIAHSLGTSVAHDAVLCLSRSVLTDGVFDARQFKWRTLAAIANTGRVMQSRWSLSTHMQLADFDVFRSTVRPGDGDANLVRQYLNFRHRADPITWPRPFAPTGFDAARYRDTEITRFGDLEKVHDFVTYFDDPEVHVPVFRAVFGKTKCSPAEKAAAVAAHAATHPNEAGSEFADLRNIAQGRGDREHTVFELVKFLVEAVRRLR